MNVLSLGIIIITITIMSLTKQDLSVGQEVEFDSPYVSSKFENKGTIKKLSTRNKMIHDDEVEIVCFNTILKRNAIVTVSPRYITK